MGWLTGLIGGFVRGISSSLMDWWRLRKAEKDRARADSFEAAHRGDMAADKTEAVIEQAGRDAETKAASDWAGLRP